MASPTAERLLHAARARLRPTWIAGRAASAVWQPHSRLFLVGDGGRWVLSEETAELARVAQRLGARVGSPVLAPGITRQSVFYASHFMLLRGQIHTGGNRVGAAYFHGRPGTPGVPEFDETFAALRAQHELVDRVQVSHSEMRDIVLASGIDERKVFLIRIALNPELFSPRTDEARRAVRRAFELPESAFVVGSFQKDGVGWEDGRRPKLIKGPDVLVETLARVKERIPELFVLLAGPARGYVIDGLVRAGIPYRHVFLEHYAEVGRLYHALDAYLVASRQEGGPKAVFEAMVSRVPLVTTRVGQAMDVVRHGENAWLAEVEDVEALAHWLVHVAGAGDTLGSVLDAGEETARANTHEAQLPEWRAFLDGFVHLPRSSAHRR